MGDVDELNSSLGVLLAEPLPDDVRELLVVVQHELFNLGGELSIPGFVLLKDEPPCCGWTRRWPTTTSSCRG
jgi:cob(I)alamin adenosyltransferase